VQSSQNRNGGGTLIIAGSGHQREVNDVRFAHQSDTLRGRIDVC
jgi:hypothetical protein